MFLCVIYIMQHFMRFSINHIYLFILIGILINKKYYRKNYYIHITSNRLNVFILRAFAYFTFAYYEQKNI